MCACVSVQSAVKTTASVRLAKYHRLSRLHDRLEYRRPSPDAPWTTRTLYP